MLARKTVNNGMIEYCVIIHVIFRVLERYYESPTHIAS